MWTPPLRELTPDTSVGFDQIDFARDVLGRPLDPWQEWLVIHAGELLPDGRPRFRVVLTLVSRQNGKTELLVVLSLFWQFVDAVPLILGTSTKLDYARESWDKSVKLAARCADLDDLHGVRWTREANGEQASWTTEGARYKIAASNAEGGRSLTINRLICDELRQHHDYSAWGAAEPATSAVWDAQIWALSNMGDSRSVVLNDLRSEALTFIESGEGDYRLGLFEWSAPEGADPRDIDALAQANPSMGTPATGGRIDPEVLMAEATKAVRTGGAALTTFKTEKMCVNVPMLDPAIDPGAWSRCLLSGDLRSVRSRVACVIDVSPDQLHVTLGAAAVLPGGRVRVEVVQAWDGLTATAHAQRDLPALLARVRPQALGWFPNGPAAALAAALKVRDGRTGWPPPGVTVDEIRGELAAVCMGLAEQVNAGNIAHSDDPLINAHIGGSEKLKRGDTWVFSRKSGHCDAAYAIAGAVHLARTLPAPIGKPRLVVAE